MSIKKIALCDCNNFYVSCERLFNPLLKKEPTVVLSNNDGCIIARSPEVKKMGIKMGQPLFQLEEEVNEKMSKFSSNYVLYGDISDRISNILKRFTPKLEIYSIDESFLDLTHIPEDELIDYITLMKSEIFRLTGIPVSIGVGPNKTIAKLMNWISKNNPNSNGVCSWWESNEIDQIDISEVWGIGRKWNKKLGNLGVKTIGQFKEMDQFRVKKLFTVVGHRTWLELNGDIVFDIETKFKKPKIVSSSRSFGRTVWQKEQVQDAIITFIEDGCKKMKSENLKARSVVVFATTSRFSDEYFVWSKKIQLFNPTNNEDSIWNEISIHLDIPMKLWAKAGVMFYNLVDEDFQSPRIFQESFERVEKPEIKSKLWMTRRDFLSPKFTTEWSDVPKLR